MAAFVVTGGIASRGRRREVCSARMALPLELLAGDDQSGRKWLQCAPAPAKREYSLTVPKSGRKKKKAEKIRGEADKFGKYMTLRRQLTLWSDFFREEHGRTPSLEDVRKSGVPGLVEKFSEYVEVRDHFWSME